MNVRREVTGDEMINDLIRMLQDRLSELLQDIRNSRIQENVCHTDTQRKQRLEIERKALERTRVRAKSRRVTSHSSALSTVNILRRSTSRLRSVPLSVKVTRDEGNFK